MKYKIANSDANYQLIKNYNLPDFVLKILASYDISTINDVLTYQQQEIKFDNIEQSVDLINHHINNKSKIVILGDYDCDGILATAILVKAFAKLNIEVGYYIPNRLSDGYGLSVDIVKKFSEKNYNLIITVDNGISANVAIEYAKSQNIDVLVSDHHQVNEELLVKDVIYLHPHFSNLEYSVSGGYVSYYLASKLIKKEDDYLQALAAITLISDIMPLVKGNRRFIRKALNNINKENYLQISLLSNGFVDSAMIGNVISPKINALGRLNDIYNPNNLVKYFCSNNKKSIIAYALEIEEANNLRKQISNDYYQNYNNLEVKNNLLFIEDENLHFGLVGLLASRLSFKNNCVSFVSTKENDLYKGSVRSIDGIDIHKIIKEYDYLFETFGGHSQALGISYHETNSHKIKNAIENSLNNIEIKEKEYLVYKINSEEINIDDIKALRYLEPFGNKFNYPLFLIEDALILQIKSIKKGLYYNLSFSFQNKIFQAIIFESDFLGKINDSIDLIVKIGINHYNGNEKINIIVEDYLLKK